MQCSSRATRGSGGLLHCGGGGGDRTLHAVDAAGRQLSAKTGIAPRGKSHRDRMLRHARNGLKPMARLAPCDGTSRGTPTIPRMMTGAVRPVVSGGTRDGA